MADGGLGQQFVRHHAPVRFPWWWTDGVKVVSGSHAGTIGRDSNGNWLVHLDGDEGDVSYVLGPDPSRWIPRGYPEMTRSQVDRIVYDSDAALCRAFGCGGIADWVSQPESRRVSDPDLRPMPVGRNDLIALRNKLREAVRAVLREFVP